MIRRLFFLLILFLPSQLLVWGQDFLPRFRHYGIGDGLSTSSVTAVCQDKEGKIWVGTQDGLNCMYGTFFKTFYQNRSGAIGLNQSSITDLLSDREGTLWIATHGGGINRMDPVSQTFLPLPEPLEKLPWKKANCLAEDKEGKIWIGFYEGLAVYNSRTGQLKTLSVVPGTNRPFSVLQIAFDENGVGFAATPFDGMFAFSGENLIVSVPFHEFFKEPNGTGFFYNLYSQEKGILACSQSGPLRFWFEGKSIRWEKAADLPGQEVTTFLRDFGGRTWMASAGSGLFLFRRDGVQVPLDLPYKGRFHGGKVNEVFQDRWGGIWVGSADGLDYSHPQLAKFQSWSFDSKARQEGLKTVWAIYTEDDQNFLLGSESGLYSFDGRNFTCTRIPFVDGRSEKVVYSFLKTRNGRMLAGTSQGVFEIWKSGDKLNADRVFGEIEGVVSCMVELPDGDLLIGTSDDRGLFRIDPPGNLKGHFLEDLPSGNGLVNNSVNCLIPGRDGKIWVGTDNGFSLFDPVLNRFDNSLWDHWPMGKKHSSLMYGFADFPDQLWIGTYGSGIVVFDKQRRTYKHLGLAEGLPNESVYQLVSQGDQVWASTNKGLCLIDQFTFRVRVFTEGDGLQSNEFNHFASFLNPASGRIYFGGISGFDEVSRFLKPENLNSPAVVLASARLPGKNGEKTLPLDGKPWELSPEDHSLEVEFSALNYLMPEKNQYSYQLLGVDQKRISLGEKNKITLVNLQPGDYILEVFARNNEGVWSAKPLRVNFTILPPFWKTLWFRMLLFVVFLGALFLIFRLYLKARLREQTLDFERKEAVRMERNRISSEMHDDLGSGLTSIKMLSELMNLKSGKDPLPEVGKISARSDELVESLNTIVWALNDRNDRMEHLVAYLRSFIRGQFEERQVDLDLDVQVSPEMAGLEIPGELRRNVFLIVKESVHNLFKHSQASVAKVQITADASGFDFRMEDNGRGGEPGKEHLGNGLRNMKARAAAFGGEIHFSGEAGFQTHFHLPLYNERGIG